MKQTKALRKISSLRKKIRVVQGGQGAGKTFAIMAIIINFASRNSMKQCYVVSSELTKMRDTVVKDAVTIINSFGLNVKMTGIESGRPKIVFPNGSFIRFIGLDKEDLGKGLRSDVIFVNEANKITHEAFREVTSRAKNVYVDFNPNNIFYVHEEVITRNDADYLTLTFLDNEALSDEERNEILWYHKKAYGVPYNKNRKGEPETISKYWRNKWRVYGLGLIGILEGAVYENWEELDELPKEAKILGAGIDFGWVHPQACVNVYEWNKRRIYDEVSFGSYKGTKIMANDIKERGTQDEVHYCDNSAPQLIQELRDNGINAIPCEDKTGLINFSVDKMNKEPFYITKRSVNLIREAQGYVWAKDSKGRPTGKPIKINDDGMNAIQYFEGSEGLYDGTY